MKIKLFMVILLMVGLSACKKESITDIDMVINDAKNFGVTLEARPDENSVYISSEPQGWESDGMKNGYVGFGPDQTGWTSFIVDNEDTTGSCSKTAKWVITQLRLSAKGDEKTQKGTAFGDRPPGWVKRAFRHVNNEGVLFAAATKEQGVTFLSVYNANRHKKSKNGKFIYYEITLSECDGDDVLTTDPGWKNGGRN